MKPKAFIVEDDFTQRFGLKMALQNAGFEVTEAEDGQSAWKVLKSDETFDLAILDFDLGDINGTTIANEIKRKNQAKKIVMASSHLEEFIKDLDKDIEVLSKPLKESDVQKITAIGYDKRDIKVFKEKLEKKGGKETISFKAINESNNSTAIEALLAEVKKNNKGLILFDKSKIKRDLIFDILSKQQELSKDIQQLVYEVRKLESEKLNERLIRIEETEKIKERQTERKFQIYQLILALLTILISILFAVKG